jgi:hypothetical protein
MSNGGRRFSDALMTCMFRIGGLLCTPFRIAHMWREAEQPFQGKLPVIFPIDSPKFAENETGRVSRPTPTPPITPFVDPYFVRTFDLSCAHFFVVMTFKRPYKCAQTS